MTRLLLPATLVLFAAGCNATLNGSLINGLTNEAIPGKAADAAETDEAVRVIAKAVVMEGDQFKDNTAAGLTCMSFSSDVQQDGSFSLYGLCLNETAYMLSLSDKTLFLGDVDMTEVKHDAKVPLTLKAWRVTNGAGVFALKDDTLTKIASRKSFGSDTISGSTETVMYPEALPKETPLVGADAHLVIAGAANANLELTPLINSGPRVFALGEGQEEPPKMSIPWSYVGTEFTDDATFERKTTTIDESKVVTLDKRGQKVRIIPASAVSPQGRHVLMAKDAKKGLILDIGVAGENPPPAEEPAPEE